MVLEQRQRVGGAAEAFENGHASELNGGFVRDGWSGQRRQRFVVSAQRRQRLGLHERDGRGISVLHRAQRLKGELVPPGEGVGLGFVEIVEVLGIFQRREVFGRQRFEPLARGRVTSEIRGEGG